MTMASGPSDIQSKKRRHRSSEDLDVAPSTAQKKKEKRHKTTHSTVSPEDALSPQKQKKKSSKSKGKSKSCASDLPSEFRIISASLVLSIPPVFALNLRAGAEEMLDSMVMRYIPSLRGVLLAHSNLQFLSQTASIRGDCPFAVCNVSFDATVWGPQVSMKLVGKINLCSPDHISLLVHRTFNVSIPRHHIPQDQWLFEYGPAENDPEFGGRDWDTGGELNDATGKDGDTETNGSIGLKVSGETGEAESSGRWVHHLTGSKLGDPHGYVEFTVIGLTVANEMLSLQGSVQPDPFSPEHVPHADMTASSPAFYRDETSEAEVQPECKGEDGEGEEDESDEDGFKYLARLTDQVKVTQKAERAKELEMERLETAKKQRKRGNRDVEGGGARQGKGAPRKRTKKVTL